MHKEIVTCVVGKLHGVNSIHFKTKNLQHKDQDNSHVTLLVVKFQQLFI